MEINNKDYWKTLEEQLTLGIKEDEIIYPSPNWTLKEYQELFRYISAGWIIQNGNDDGEYFKIDKDWEGDPMWGPVARFCVDCEKTFFEPPENVKEDWVSTKCCCCSGTCVVGRGCSYCKAPYDSELCDCVYCCVCGEVNMTELYPDNMEDTCVECKDE